MKRLEFITPLLFLWSLAAIAAPGIDSFVGRWEFTEEETGYFIQDRYSDGRFAEKSFLFLPGPNDSVEISVTWGHWRLVDSKYEETIDGTTSPFISSAYPKSMKWDVAILTAKTFGFTSKDSLPRHERKVPADRPLFRETVSITTESKTGLRGDQMQVNSTALKAVPTWVNGFPK